MHRACLLGTLGLLATACTRPNPAFDPDAIAGTTEVGSPQTSWAVVVEPLP